MLAMSRGRVIWIAIQACGWACWLAAGTALIWHWMDPHVATFLAGGMLLLTQVLEKAGVKRMLVGGGKENEQAT
jgi:hypothetical protein